MSTIPLPEPSAQPESSAVSRMTGVILAPGKTFAEIARRPTWVAPFIILCILSIGVSALLAQKTDWRAFFERQMAKNSQTEQMPQEQKDRILDSQVKYAPQFALAFGLVGTALFVLFVTLVYWGAFNLFFGAGLGFKTAFGIVTHACVPLIISSVLGIVVLLIKHRGDVDPEHFLASNVAAFFTGPRAALAGNAGAIAGAFLDMDDGIGGAGIFGRESQEDQTGGSFSDGIRNVGGVGAGESRVGDVLTAPAAKLSE